MGKRDTKIIPKVQLLVGKLCSHLRQGLRLLLHMLSKLLKLDPASMIFTRVTLQDLSWGEHKTPHNFLIRATKQSPTRCSTIQPAPSHLDGDNHQE
jgi:hypothetical protein